VTHVDSIKQVVAWGKKNMELSSQQDIRWIVEDAQKFVQREARRVNTYDMIIMDPPSFGQGTKGEKWKLEDKLNDLLSDINKISNPSTKWIVNTYSGLSPVMLTNLVREHRSAAPIDCQEIVIRSKSGTSLPLGTVARVG
jgi:23S rRNA (cytosine1962-C5)-methyltransferase